MTPPQFILGTLLATAAPPSANAAWDTYANARFGFHACYPAEMLVPQGEAYNGDGQTFIARGGAELRVFGTNNVLDQPISQEVADQARGYTGARGRITYCAAEGNWQVVSGKGGAAGLFYLKTIARRGQFVTLQLRYPKAATAVYKPVVERMAHCFAVD